MLCPRCGKKLNSVPKPDDLTREQYFCSCSGTKRCVVEVRNKPIKVESETPKEALEELVEKLYGTPTETSPEVTLEIAPKARRTKSKKEKL